jgi:methylase of polypeptide subunit release factors
MTINYDNLDYLSVSNNSASHNKDCNSHLSDPITSNLIATLLLRIFNNDSELSKFLPDHKANIDLICTDKVLTETFFNLYKVPTIIQTVVCNLSPYGSIRETKDFILEDKILEYEKMLSTKSRKQSGSFYTETDLVDLLIKEIPSTLLNNAKILDPACGTGIFTTRLIRGYLSKNDFINLESFIRQITLCDINPVALTISWLSVKILLHEYLNDQLNLIRTISPEICLDDFLLSNNTLITNQKFDLMIGNPPYGLSRDEQISSIDNLKYKENYKRYLTGKPNKYMLFIARSLELLNKDGICAFIVPNSWLGIKSGINLRKEVLKNFNLLKIITFNKTVFKDAAVEAQIIYIQNSKSKENAVITNYHDAFKPYDLKSNLTIDLNFSKNHLNFRVPIYWHKNATKILNTIYGNSTLISKLSHHFKPLIALQAYALGKGSPKQTKETVESHPFHFNTKKNKNCYPYLIGKDLKRYQISWSGEYLQYGEWLAEPQTIDRFNCPRIIIREILGSYSYLFIASYTEDIYFYNKSILHILGSNSTQLKCLLAVLNSKIASYILKHIGIKSQRKLFPKLVLDDIKNFPLANSLIESPESLSTLVSEMIYNPDDINLGNQIDQEVAKAYGISLLDLE